MLPRGRRSILQLMSVSGHSERRQLQTGQDRRERISYQSGRDDLMWPVFTNITGKRCRENVEEGLQRGEI